MGSAHPIHRNITFGRLLCDAFQCLRTQRPVTRLLGRPFAVSRRFVEIDITYRCNLRCPNCNRSCTQAPCDLEMPPDTIAAFINESLAAGIRWERVRLLGGEPTLHRQFFTIIEKLDAYRRRHNPGMRLVVCTHGTGARVRSALARLPDTVVVKNTFKQSRPPLFRPFNRAPIDSPWHRFSDFASGCRIISECGLGLTPLGYYTCAVAGGIDRVFGFGLGRRALPGPSDSLIDQREAFCPLCGHFGFSCPTRRTKVSPTWERAYGLRRARIERGLADWASGDSAGRYARVF
jgi:hypothetical protein